MKKLIAALPSLQKLYIDAMQCTWNIYCLSEIMQWISVAKELQFLTFKMRSDQGNYGFEQFIFYLRHSNFYQLTQNFVPVLFKNPGFKIIRVSVAKELPSFDIKNGVRSSTTG